MINLNHNKVINSMLLIHSIDIWNDDKTKKFIRICRPEDKIRVRGK